MSVQAYINFNGNCKEAVKYYAEIFGTDEPQIMYFREMPPNPDFELPEEALDLVLHTSLVIHDTTVMFSDIFPGMPFIVGNNISLTVLSNDMNEVESLFAKLKEEGSVEMELQETFWSKCYGSLTDKFGIVWQFSYEENPVDLDETEI